jgi:4-alpha-glucanotransferase
VNIRSSGILLPVFSLPSRFGIGDLGPCSHQMVDFLHDAGQRYWQMLPINPTVSTGFHSPYQGPSAFAFNPLLISPESLYGDGLLSRQDIERAPAFPEKKINYEAVFRFKKQLFLKAFERFSEKDGDAGFIEFCEKNDPWLQDFSCYTALKTHFNEKPWRDWPTPIRLRQKGALRSLANHLFEEITFIKFLQYIFFVQWQRLKNYCKKKGIHLLGDIPIYVPYDSADVWANPKLFKLDRQLRPEAVSGVPPDYFSKTGQLWGHPVYRWTANQKTRYAWWGFRIAHNLSLFDAIRIDHFRGLVAYWEVPSGKRTAKNGKWVNVPSVDFFDEMMRRFTAFPVIAEDLGYITADVREIMRCYDFPGMRLLVFGFSGDLSTNPNAPHNIVRNCVIYTGTHDTNTIKGWHEEEAAQSEKEQLFAYLGRRIPAGDLPLEMIRLAMISPAFLCIISMQDLSAAPRKQLRQMTELYARA